MFALCLCREKQHELQWEENLTPLVACVGKIEIHIQKPTIAFLLCDYHNQSSC